tara:strand:+ start:808 stop:1005 length:198 start_codon:yes stop_codon:yes gene_type:complete
MNKIEFNKRMVGKKVSLLNMQDLTIGKILEVLDEDNFIVETPDGEKITASIYDIRSLEDVKRKEK